MTRCFYSVGMTVLTLAIGVAVAHGQCNFARPAKAKEVKTALVQASVPCTVPNVVTEGGVPACQPPQTPNDLAGNPSDGWRFGPKGKGTVSLKAAKNKLVGPLTPANDSSDVAVALQLADIEDVSGPATSTGSFDLVVRLTLNDRVGGDMTLVDFPVSFGVGLAAGKAKIKTTLNTALTLGYGMAGLPACVALELVSAELRDTNGTTFALSGTVSFPSAAG